MAHTTHHAHRAGTVTPADFSAAGLASLGAAAGAPSAIGPPTTDEAPRLAGAEGFSDQRQTEQPDCAAPLAHDQDGGQFAALVAVADKCGIALHEPAGGYLLCRWGHCRELPDLRAVAQLLRQMGVHR